MAVKIDKKKNGPNDHIGEPVDAPVGHMPRVVKVPMHDNADVNPKFHAAKEEEKKSKTPDVKKGAGWNAKDERQYNHIKDSGASESIAAATVNKQRRKEGHTKMKPKVSIAKGGPGSGPKDDGGYGAAAVTAGKSAHQKSSLANMSQSRPTHVQAFLHHDAAGEHERAHEFHRIAGNVSQAAVHKNLAVAHRQTSGALQPYTSKSEGENDMTKSAISDLFKAELGNDSNSPITNCVHCKHGLTHEDLHKGLGPQFVVDDNDNPHSGGDGQVEPSRPGSGVSEHDAIAPLLKSCNGPEAGDQEEYPISKSEMVQMGMNVDEMKDGWYKISKSEMTRLEAGDHIAYLAGRKALIAKGLPGGGAKLPPRGPSPIKPFVPHKPLTSGNRNEPPIKKGGTNELVIWETGTDQEVADYIEKSGHLGIGDDEPIRTQGNGEG